MLHVSQEWTCLTSTQHAPCISGMDLLNIHTYSMYLRNGPAYHPYNMLHVSQEWTCFTSMQQAPCISEMGRLTTTQHAPCISGMDLPNIHTTCSTYLRNGPASHPHNMLHVSQEWTSFTFTQHAPSISGMDPLHIHTTCSMYLRNGSACTCHHTSC